MGNLGDNIGAVVQSLWGLGKIAAAGFIDSSLIDLYLVTTGLGDLAGGVMRNYWGLRPDSIRTFETWVLENGDHLKGALNRAISSGRETYDLSKYGTTDVSLQRRVDEHQPYLEDI